MMLPWRRSSGGVPSVTLEEEEARLRVRRDQLIEAVARKVVAKRLETPTVFFLEMHKPISFLAGQSLLIATPLLGAFIPPSDLEDVARLLEDRSNVDRLIARIEDLADARDEERRGKSSAPERIRDA